MSWSFAIGALICGSTAAIAALILVEFIARKFCDAKEALARESDPVRDGEFDYRSMEQ
jgi:hypothetical protein